MFYFNHYLFWFVSLVCLGLLFLFLGLYFIFLDYSFFFDYEIFIVHGCSFTFTLFFDYASLLFMCGVFFISSMVLYYSDSYMSGDMNKLRFIFLVLLFVLSMCFMILSPNLFSILLGWDGLGLVSYSLVIFYSNVKSYNAGMLTVLTNRIGDVCILLSISFFFDAGGWGYLFYNFYFIDPPLYMLIVLAAFTKSAQVPFSSWLPAAMAAPTPVSSLVHSSTLVTAGVYLLIRFYPCISYSSLPSLFLFVSLITMFMSGLAANFEFDLKKVIALSTLSQLGLMMSIIFIGFPLVSFFHLLSHAFFSALLFLCAGLFIHNMCGSQDIRHMGVLVNQLPYTVVCFCIANMSLCGLPFLSGFYSKDLVLELLSYSSTNFLLFIIFFVSIGLTVSYSMRLMYYCLLDYNGLFVSVLFFEDSRMMNCMLFLVLMSISFGCLFSWLFSPMIFLLLPLYLKIMPLFFVFLGGFIGYEVAFFFNISFNLFSHLCFFYFGNMWFMPFFSTWFLSSSGLILSNYFVSLVDCGWGEYLVSRSFYNLFYFLGNIILYFQFNYFKLYFVSFVFFFLMVMFI